MLSQEDARKILATPKMVVVNGELKGVYELDFTKGNEFRISLADSDSIDKSANYLLRIGISDKIRTKISLHTQENDTRFCLFRLDYNGARHQNPATINEFVPEKMIPYAGQMIGANHVHYHVQGYESGKWALPLEDDDFPVKNITKDNYSGDLKETLQALSEVIHLETKLVFIGRMLYDVD